MGQVLSQSEVDALLSAVSEGEGESQEGKTGSGALQDVDQMAFEESGEDEEITSYDLTNQDRVIRGRMPTLDIIYERFVRLFRMSLSNSLRKIATISIISTDLMKFGEFVNTLPIPSCMCIVRFKTLRGLGLIVFESKLAYALVDSYFGGTDRPYTKIEGKEFTRIELSIMKKVMNLSIRDLEEAWSPVHKTDIEYLRIEVNPQFVGVVSPSEVIIATTFEVELENASGTIVLVIPYSTIEPIKQKLGSSFQTETDRVDFEWQEMLEEHIRSATVDFVVTLGEAEMTVSDLVNLSIGDVITLHQDIDQEIIAKVEGVRKFSCLMGISKGNRAVQIKKLLED